MHDKKDIWGLYGVEMTSTYTPHCEGVGGGGVYKYNEVQCVCDGHVMLVQDSPCCLWEPNQVGREGLTKKMEYQQLEAMKWVCMTWKAWAWKHGKHESSCMQAGVQHTVLGWIWWLVDVRATTLDGAFEPCPSVLFCAYLPPPPIPPYQPFRGCYKIHGIWTIHLHSDASTDANQAGPVKFSLHTCASGLTQLAKIGWLFHDLELFGWNVPGFWIYNVQWLGQWMLCSDLQRWYFSRHEGSGPVVLPSNREEEQEEKS